jgi:hypothetical protein
VVAHENDEESERRSSLGFATFEANAHVLEGMRARLQHALQARDRERVFLESVKVLDWGGVYKGSLRWVIERHESAELTSCIERAVSLLDGDSDHDLSVFNSELRMDSGLTKIYALAGQRSVIYDDRVGAALALLAGRYLNSIRAHSIPEELGFVVGAGKRCPMYRGSRFPSRVRADGAAHARSNLHANWIIGAVVNRADAIWGLTIPCGKMRAIEAALFMIGYDVSAP